MSWKVLGFHRQRVASAIDLSVHEHVRVRAAAVSSAVIRPRRSAAVRLLNVVVSYLKQRNGKKKKPTITHSVVTSVH